MKKHLLLLTITILGFRAIAQDFQWGKSIGATGADKGSSIATDAAGNVYTTGSFSGTADFDPGVGIADLISVGGADIFILKLNASGIFVWAKSIGSTSNDEGLSIAVDASGNVYTTGSFSGIADFDPGAGIFSLTSVGSTDIFISKLNGSGDIVWAKRMGGTGVDIARSIAVDVSGNVYTTGSYSGTADFDPGAGTYSLASLKNGDDIFLSKINAAGDFLWAKTAGGGGGDYGYALAIDASGNVYSTGYFNGDANFNPSGGGAPGTSFYTSAGSTDIFILKLDALGSFAWAKRLGGAGADIGYSIAVDALANVYTTGSFSGTADFDPGAATANLTSAAGADIFISKLDVSGNFTWAKNIGGNGGDTGYSIKVDGTGNVYTTGSFAGTVDFDPGAGTDDQTSDGGADIFISKLDVSGNFVMAKKWGGVNDDLGYSIAVDASENLYTTGYFNGTVDFDPGAGTYDQTSAGGTDIFISKLGTTAFPITLLTFEAVKKENDAYLTWITATESNTDKFEIERSDDGLLFKYIGHVKATGNSNTTKTYSFSDKNAGVVSINPNLYYRFKQIDLDGKFTYSPIRSINFNHDFAGIRVYPNPTKDAIRIQVSYAQLGSGYSITAETGKRVIAGQLNNRTTTINIKSLAAGIYFVQVGGLRNNTFKVVKQ